MCSYLNRSRLQNISKVFPLLKYINNNTSHNDTLTIHVEYIGTNIHDYFITCLFEVTNAVSTFNSINWTKPYKCTTHYMTTHALNVTQYDLITKDDSLQSYYTTLSLTYIIMNN